MLMVIVTETDNDSACPLVIICTGSVLPEHRKLLIHYNPYLQVERPVWMVSPN